jgi:hypothetical protein
MEFSLVCSWYKFRGTEGNLENSVTKTGLGVQSSNLPSVSHTKLFSVGITEENSGNLNMEVARFGIPPSDHCAW